MKGSQEATPNQATPWLHPLPMPREAASFQSTVHVTAYSWKNRDPRGYMIVFLGTSEIVR